MGQARRKIIPILRLYIAQENIGDSYQPIGVNLAWGWADNKANFSLDYQWVYDYDNLDEYGNPPVVASQTVYIEDLYDLGGADDDVAINDKVNAITTHLNLSTTNGPKPGAWYIAFASATNKIYTTPEVSVGQGGALIYQELPPFLVNFVPRPRPFSTSSH